MNSVAVKLQGLSDLVGYVMHSQEVASDWIHCRYAVQVCPSVVFACAAFAILLNWSEIFLVVLLLQV